MMSNLSRRLCCTFCSLVSLFSMNKNTHAGFRNICHSSAKCTALVCKHFCSWSLVALSILGLTRVYSEENTIKERVCFSGMFLITMILGTLNTCDMIYEYTETKEQQKNNNKEKSIKDKNS